MTCFYSAFDRCITNEELASVLCELQQACNAVSSSEDDTDPVTSTDNEPAAVDVSRGSSCFMEIQENI